YCDVTAWIGLAAPPKQRLGVSNAFSLSAITSSYGRAKLKSFVELELRQGYNHVDMRVQVSMKPDHSGIQIVAHGPIPPSELSRAISLPANVKAHNICPIAPDLARSAGTQYLSNRLGSLLTWTQEIGFDLNLDVLLYSLETIFYKSNILS